ncbi:hypothetical protein KCU98_g13541, partial [Aureobasidium melanogenum]
MGDDELLSNRVTAVIKTLSDVRRDFPDDRVVVFSNFVEFLDLVAEAFLRSTKTLAFHFDGTVKEGDRQTIRAAWSNSKSPHPPILVTAGAGGAEMNLQAGNHVVRRERWWTESEEMQADARCHRKNQAKQVRLRTMDGKTSRIDDDIKQARDRKAAANAVNVQGKRFLRSARLNCLL